MIFKYVFYLSLSLSLSLSLLLAACQHHPDINARQQATLQHQAASIVKQFVDLLKPQLKQALQHGGPAHAIEICSKTAPALAVQLSKKSGWKIKRVSLKARNHHTAIPNAWEASVLQQFDRDRTNGRSPANMVASRVGGGTYRFMKAQPVVPVCLLCHGEHISPDVAAALKHYYPKDQAKGYKLGQIRGAFSLTRQL